MRISTSQVFKSGISAMQRAQSDLNHTQLQLSTGKRILSPSEDPSGATQAVRLQAGINSVEQYQRNLDQAQPRLEFEESQLEAVSTSVQRVRELVLAAGNDTYTDDDRATTANEIRQIRDGILAIANTQDANGEYLFAGTKSLNKPFVADAAGAISYVGANGVGDVRDVSISATRSVKLGDTGQAVFMDIPGTGGQSLFGMLDAIATTLESGISGEPLGTATGIALTNIDATSKRLSDIQTTVGTRLQALDSQNGLNDEQIVSLKSSLSEVSDLDYAEAISRFQLQNTVLQAAQQTYTAVTKMSLFNFL